MAVYAGPRQLVSRLDDAGAAGRTGRPLCKRFRTDLASRDSWFGRATGDVADAFPTAQIGGTNAVVQFAGLVTPGLYQINLYVPTSTPNGDNAIMVQYNGQSTQAGVLLTVQHYICILSRTPVAVRRRRRPRRAHGIHRLK